MYRSKCKLIIVLTVLILTAVPVEAVVPDGLPVVITGKDLPYLLGKPVSSIRVQDMSGKAIPFQVDEITADGEYVLDVGELSNTRDGNGVFDRQDEIVFLWGDADVSANVDTNRDTEALVTVTIAYESRVVFIRSDPSVPMSPKRYVEYDHATHRVVTPYYYADFAKDRFHFLRAGVRRFDGRGDGYLDLTNELRVNIHLRALFGLVPIRYNENSMVCLVRRYKVGPIRLIRRGDFHLNLGLGVRGSKAAVNQICYPNIVKVPVSISLPVNFRTLFSQAYVEMIPVIREGGRDFRFIVGSENINWPIWRADSTDTLHPAMPAGKMFSVRNGATGYGWHLNTTMDPAHLNGSGFVLRRPPSGKSGIAECGFRLTVRDVTKGNYYINNRVLFSSGRQEDIVNLERSMNLPMKIGIRD